LKDHYSNYWTIRVGKENKCLFSGTATGHQQQGTGRKNLIQTSLATAVEIRGDEKYAGDCRSVRNGAGIDVACLKPPTAPPRRANEAKATTQIWASPLPLACPIQSLRRDWSDTTILVLKTLVARGRNRSTACNCVKNARFILGPHPRALGTFLCLRTLMIDIKLYQGTLRTT
jgi:hypothetical protein